METVTLPCSNKFELENYDDVKNDSVVSWAEPSSSEIRVDGNIVAFCCHYAQEGELASSIW